MGANGSEWEPAKRKNDPTTAKKAPAKTNNEPERDEPRRWMTSLGPSRGKFNFTSPERWELRFVRREENPRKCTRTQNICEKIAPHTENK